MYDKIHHKLKKNKESCGEYTQWNIAQLLKKDAFEAVLMRWMKGAYYRVK